jgi:glycosyltransferase involved in cell wall biosynthesis
VVGIFAHNEQSTIRQVVDAFLAQRLSSVELPQIVVVCCGCSDLTIPMLRRVAAREPRLRVLIRAQREGKVAAINEFLRVAQADLLVLASADVVPAEDLVERLIRPLLTDGRSMMTGPRVLVAPTNKAPRRLVDDLHDELWALHHAVALRRPKLGEIVAVRRGAIGPALPSDVHCDEALMESVVVARGGRLRYVADALAYNTAPPGIAAFYRQRRRIAAQHRTLRRRRGYVPATADPALVVDALRTVPRARLATLVVLAALEAAARAHGAWDLLRGRTYQTWRPARAGSSGAGEQPPLSAVAHALEPSPITREVSPL